MSLKRICGIYCLATSALVAIQFVISTLYDPVLVDRVWAVIDWLMALGIVVCLIAGVRWRLDDAGGEVTRLYLERTAILVASVLLALWFAWNWFAYLEGDGDETVLMWAFIDPLFVLTAGACGLALIKGRP